jgi:hypothetical protein
MSPEELAELHTRREAGRVEREARKAAAAATKESALASPFSIAIDCTFEHLMESREVKSMVHQFQMCYAANSRAAVPARLCLAGLRGELAAGYDNVCGTDKWPVRRRSMRACARAL